MVRFVTNDVITSTTIASHQRQPTQIQITRMIYPDSLWLSLSQSYPSASLSLSIDFLSTHWSTRVFKQKEKRVVLSEERNGDEIL